MLEVAWAKSASLAIQFPLWANRQQKWLSFNKMSSEGSKPKRPPDVTPVSFAVAKDGCKLAYRVWNNSGLEEPLGVPLVLVQGWMCVKEDWAGLDRILCKRIRAPVVIFDNRGIGESDVPGTPYSVAQFAEDVLTVVDAALGNVNFDLLGISMGGCVVQLAALSGNPRVRRIVLGCTTPGGPEASPGPGLATSMQIVQDPASQNLSPRELSMNLHYNNLPASWIEDHPDMFDQFLADSLRHSRPHKGIILQMKALMKFNVASRLAHIKIPTLILHGDEDQVVPIDAARILHQRITNSHFVELKGAAHLFWITHLHDAVRPIAAFLNSPQQHLDKSPHLMVSATSSNAARAKL